MFLKIPYIPEKPVICVIVDQNAPKQLIDNLSKFNITTILSAKIHNIMTGISTHPDMQIHHIRANEIICEPTLYEYYYSKLSPLGFEIKKGNKIIKSNYPNDIAYNISRIGNNIIHNTKYSDSKILKFYKENNFCIVNSKQGYTKCATCIVSENAIITSDRGIERSLRNTDIDVLLINEGEIELEGLNYGFIGGCCGLIDKDKLAFCGKIENHSSFSEIKKFAKKHSVDIISLCQQKLTDIGSIIPIILA